ncbi:hypothetical protein QQ045_011522 [Rhodiola kirilowii]
MASTSKQEGKQPMDWYSDLYTAAFEGDYEKAVPILDEHREVALRAKIDGCSGGTALHVAVDSGPRSIPFVQNLVARSVITDLELKNDDGCTPLEIAARIGNLEAAKVLVNMLPDSVYIPSSSRAGTGQRVEREEWSQIRRDSACRIRNEINSNQRLENYCTSAYGWWQSTDF